MFELIIYTKPKYNHILDRKSIVYSEHRFMNTSLFHVRYWENGIYSAKLM